MLKSIRWRQRFEVFEMAYKELEEAVLMPSYSKLERGGLIQAFEFTFELSWKTLKDYLEMQGVVVNFPRDVFKEAFAKGLFSEKDVEVLLDALDKRNILSHTYNQEMAYLSEGLIKNEYFPKIKMLYGVLKEKIEIPIFGLDLKIFNLLLTTFVTYQKITEVKIFGSRAMGNAKFHSDIDLCLFGDLTLHDAADVKRALDGIIPYACDVVVYSLLSSSLKEHVDQFGKSVYKKS